MHQSRQGQRRVELEIYDGRSGLEKVANKRGTEQSALVDSLERGKKNPDLRR